MNIDLLLTPQGEAGLVSDKGFAGPIAGVMFDAQTGQMTLEFGDADSLDLNIPVGQEYAGYLARAHLIHVGAIEKGTILESRQVPLVLQQDPFGGGNLGSFPVRPRNSVTAFESFMKRCSSGQPAHRDDLGDEASASSVLSGMSPAVLQFAPHLSRQRAMEAAPKAALAPRGPSGPGGMGGGGAAPRMNQPRPQAPPEDENET